MNTLSNTQQLAVDLIARESVTPVDAGCQELMSRRLQAIGFSVQQLRFDDVDNFWAVKGDNGPILCFAGHTDVVPTGPLEDWTSPPFKAEIRDNTLYGRGVADMKGAVAAMATAAPPKLNSRVATMPLIVKAMMPSTQPAKNRSSVFMSRPVWNVKPTPAVMQVAKISTMATVTAVILCDSGPDSGHAAAAVGLAWR